MDRVAWRLQSVGSQRVGQERATKHSTLQHIIKASNVICKYTVNQRWQIRGKE